MNRKQFMEQLERLLSDISEAERQEALEYYEDIFISASRRQIRFVRRVMWLLMRHRILA